ncbi:MULTISPECIES: MFS transporter [Streptomyces]|uniref:Multidrug efflux pump Tap n=1 Tax=Streptomyces heilongjiangensis TaxID=945052 RepID=A0ABW1B5V4_9ACTN|nr:MULTISPECIES: MFS transporter [Streptomyces]MDC2946983.1 MFS transporter [Streptomyces heilongjiangensis]
MLPLYLLSHGLSLLGNTVASIALPWLVLLRTGDAAAVGLVAAASALPMLLSAVLGGVLIDRVGRRRLSIGADLASAACVAALPVVDGVLGLTVVWFVVLGVAGAVFDVPGMTAREALAPDIAEATGISMERLAGLRESIAGGVVILAPAAAGGLIMLVDPATVLWVTAGCSALAALVTLALPKTIGAQPPAGGEAAGLGGDVKRGFGVLRGDRVLTAVTLVSAGSVAVLAPLQNLVLPVHLVAEDSPGGFGVVVSLLAVGGIAGAAVYAAVGTRFSRRTVFVAAQVTSTVGVAGLALLPPVPVMWAAAVLAGAGAGPLPALFLVLVTERIPEEVRGRVLGLQNAVSMTAVPLGTLAAGLVVERVGLRPTGMFLAVAWGAVTLAILALPALRGLDAATETAIENQEAAPGDDRRPGEPRTPERGPTVPGQGSETADTTT